MEKSLVIDGQVAVAISPGYGAGWSTWEDVSPLDGRFNTLFHESKYDEAEKLCEQVGIESLGIADEILIIWVPLGAKFIIREYDGHEWIELESDIDFFTAA
jgi:hypothetical protein